jgi:hypothetical protein
MQCLEVQPVSSTCSTSSCNGFPMARYFCSICNFFDNDDRCVFCQCLIMKNHKMDVISDTSVNGPQVTALHSKFHVTSQQFLIFLVGGIV